MNPFGSNRSKQTREQQISATNHELINSRLYIVFAAAENGEIAIKYSNPEVTVPVQPQVAQEQPRDEVVRNPFWNTAAETQAPTAPAAQPENDMATDARAQLASIYNSNTTSEVDPNMVDPNDRKDQYGLAA